MWLALVNNAIELAQAAPTTTTPPVYTQPEYCDVARMVGPAIDTAAGNAWGLRGQAPELVAIFIGVAVFLIFTKWKSLVLGAIAGVAAVVIVGGMVPGIVSLFTNSSC